MHQGMCMKNRILLCVLTLLLCVNNTHTMELAHGHTDFASLSYENKAAALEQAMLLNPSQSFELVQAFIEMHKTEMHERDPQTQNTPLHVNAIEFLWGEKPARLLAIAALLACGADRSAKNLEGLTPAECAQEAGNQALLELLSVEKPDKRTLIWLVNKYEDLQTLKPLLIE